ncbi:MAG: hypothetical protein C4335_13270 [Armatimonadota bacterium]
MKCTAPFAWVLLLLVFCRFALADLPQPKDPLRQPAVILRETPPEYVVMYRTALQKPAELLRFLQQHVRFMSEHKDRFFQLDSGTGHRELDRLLYTLELLGEYGKPDLIPALERFIQQRQEQDDALTEYDVTIARLTIERIQLRAQGRAAYLASMIDWVRRGDKSYPDSVDAEGRQKRAGWLRVFLGAVALSRLKTPEAVPVLMEKQREVGIGFTLVRALAQFGDPRTQDVLGKEVTVFRAGTIAGMAELVRPLRPGEVDPAWAYWQMRTKGMNLSETVRTLVAALGGTGYRAWAGEVLEKIREPAIPLLMEAAKNPPGENPEQCQIEVTYLLGKLKANQMVPFLRELLRNAIRNARWRLSTQIASTLGDLGDASALPELIEAAREGDFHTQCSAVASLGEIGDPRAEPFLLDLLSTHPNGNVRFVAVESLAKLGTARSLAVLRARLSAEPESSIQGRIRVAIEQIERRTKR